jgi:hypothetical protein
MSRNDRTGHVFVRRRTAKLILCNILLKLKIYLLNSVYAVAAVLVSRRSSGAVLAVRRWLA